MLRLIMRPLIVCIWLCAVVALVTLLLATAPEAEALTFSQVDARNTRWLVYYDLARSLSVRVPYRNTGVVLQREAIQPPRTDQYVAPRATRTGRDLFLVTAGSQAELQLTRIEDFPPPAHQFKHQRDNILPRWSPDQSWIAFASIDPMAVTDVYLIRPDGSDLTLVARDVGAASLYLNWNRLYPLEVAPLVVLLAALIAVPVIMMLRPRLNLGRRTRAAAWDKSDSIPI